MQQQNRKENDPGRQEKKNNYNVLKKAKEVPNLKKTTKDNNSNRIQRSEMGGLLLVKGSFFPSHT